MELDGREDGVFGIGVDGETEFWDELSGTPATTCIVPLGVPVVKVDAASTSNCSGVEL